MKQSRGNDEMFGTIEQQLWRGRRGFLGRSAGGLGLAALGGLLGGEAAAGPVAAGVDVPHVLPRAKRVIFLFQS
ncbi:MAG: sulfatase, partial [Planctomycetaceae bacterium]